MAKTQTTEAEYTKAQFLSSKTLPYSKDIVAVVLLDGESVTIAEMKKRVDEFLKRKVAT